MTIAEFIEVTSRLEKYFEKELNTIQSEEWFEALQDLSKEKYQKIIQQAFKTCKYFPKLADIIEIKRNIKFVSEAEVEEKIHVPCKICGSVGLIRYYQEKDGYKYEYLARCKCENAKNYEWKDKDGNYLLPSAVALNLVQ